MEQVIIGLSGQAGAGKDTFADLLKEEACTLGRRVQKISLSDPMKRAVADWFAWDDERLWGPSEARNAPDPKYQGLSARKALQFLGTEIGRQLYSDLWIDYALRQAGQVLSFEAEYNHMRGIRHPMLGKRHTHVVVIPDVRFLNEMTAIRASGQGVLIRIKRDSAGLSGAAAKHKSEAEQQAIRDDAFDYVINNNGSFDDLRTQARQVLQSIGELPSSSII